MAVIKPFRALRPKKEFVHQIASVPYDVVSREEAFKLAEGNELSLLHVTRSEIEFEETVNPYSDQVYLKAKENLQKLIDSSLLFQDTNEHLYLYRLIMGEQQQIGIAGTFSVDDYDNDVIKKHEKTRKEKEDDRTKHILTTSAQTGPVFLTYTGNSIINGVVESVVVTQEPEYDFISIDGIKHTLWIVPDNLTEIIIDELAKIKNLYIADGHHRAASASRARKERKLNNPKHTGKEEYNYFIAVLFPAEQLKILPYNRVILDLNGKSKEEVLNQISESFIVEKTNESQPAEPRNFCMYLDGEWYLLSPRDRVYASLSLSKSVGESLDVSILQNFILSPILGIDNPRTNKRIDFIGGIRGTAELEKLVDSKKAAIAFSLFPVTVHDLIRISDEGEVMPPKSTWFEPKLRDGILIHLI